jgi:phosphohistidine phosphatase
MKQLLIVRHAKSSWDISALNDFERPLNERGHADAPIMAQRILAKKVSIDLFVSSTAKRALTTASYFASAFDSSNNDILKIDELYHAAVPTFYKIIATLNNQFNTVTIFSHNPGITEFINELTAIKLDNMPTCGVFAIAIDTDNWKFFASSQKEFLFFDYPKAI